MTADYVVPDKTQYISKPMIKRIGAYGIYLNSYSNAYKYDGSPKYQTGSGFGH
jgi:hypothetical protein